MEESVAISKEEYEELEVQRSAEPPATNHANEIYGTYLNKEISLFGKAFLGLMFLCFALSFAVLIFSYTPWGISFLREFKINIF